MLIAGWAVLFGVLIFSVLLAVACLLGLRHMTHALARDAEARLPPRGGFIDTSGGRLHYVDVGQGPPLIMIHGLGGQLQHFTYALIEALSNDFRVIAIDRPGSGYSDVTDNERARLPCQARALHEAWRALGVERPLVVGHSMGGAVALTLALEYPQEVAGLALLAPLVAQVSDVPPAMRLLAIRSPRRRRWMAETLAIPLTRVTSRQALAQVFAPEAVPADYATRGGGLLALRPQAFHAASTDLAMLEHELPRQVSRYVTLGVPLGVIFGAHDGILEPALHIEALQRSCPDMLVHVEPEAGHMLPIMRPDVTAAFIRRMAARAWPSSS
ncbi:alpha/beta fold hydrolase [Chromohalobacter sarecensis]|uniref:Alpha/beta fold hydrolase n=1 Tax=Chromohalobacter sarecensis TaxID=245294 RepID=A0ABV9D1V5_9GAMM|nr:alpha/beta fold hydrolase [Chromohalobacter sarecensis]MCK0715140.1 alpha/beta fold hydrolase [Chromohalobacter sarecensis]